MTARRTRRQGKSDRRTDRWQSLCLPYDQDTRQIGPAAPVRMLRRNDGNAVSTGYQENALDKISSGSLAELLKLTRKTLRSP